MRDLTFAEASGWQRFKRCNSELFDFELFGLRLCRSDGGKSKEIRHVLKGTFTQVTAESNFCSI